MFTINTKLIVGNAVKNGFSNPKVILLKKLPQEVSKKINYYLGYDIVETNPSDYEYEEIYDLKPYELSIEKGYTGGIGISNIDVVHDMLSNSVYLTVNNITFYNNALEPNEFDVYGFAIIDGNEVKLIEQFKSKIEVRKDDFILRFRTANINGVDIPTLMKI